MFVTKNCQMKEFPLSMRVAEKWGLGGMIRTIILSSRISVQGIFVQALADGRIAVRVGKDLFYGRPV